MSRPGGKGRAPGSAPILMSGLHLTAALWALAIVQPLLNLLGNNLRLLRRPRQHQQPDHHLRPAADDPAATFRGLIEALVNLLQPGRPVDRSPRLLCCALPGRRPAGAEVVRRDGPAWPMIIFAIVLGGL